MHDTPHTVKQIYVVRDADICNKRNTAHCSTLQHTAKLARKMAEMDFSDG